MTGDAMQRARDEHKETRRARIVRVLIVDDSALMRKLLSEMLSSEADLEVVGTARDGEEAISKARELRPDVVILDNCQTATYSCDALLIPCAPRTSH